MESNFEVEISMTGGYMKTTSRFALAAVAGLLMSTAGVSSVKAADLGGNCCADLEERIAELEATTARKSNRKVSLTIGGQVSRGVLWYDDGSMTGFRVADNIQSSSRMRMTGNAKIGNGWSAGYYLEIEYVSTGSFGTDQIDARRSLPTIDGGVNNAIGAQPNGHGNSPFSLGIRQSHWYLKNDRLGTVSVGRLNSATKDMAGTDLGGISILANSDIRIIGGEMFLRRTGATGREGLCAAGLGCTNTLRWTTLSGGFGDNFRIDGVRYDSPTLMGFTLSAAVGDDYRWDVALRHEAEWNGLRVASAIGYVVDMDELSFNGEPGTTSAAGATAGAAGGPFGLKPGRREQHDLKLNGSVWHMPSGLFLNTAFWRKSFHGTSGASGTGGGVDGTSNAFCQTGGINCQKPTTEEMWFALGIKRNFFGIGYTSLYGEYGKVSDGLTGQALNFTGIGGGAAVNLAAVTDSSYKLWGLGVVQNIDAAAMELYMGYQHRSADVTGCTAGNGAANCSGINNTDNKPTVKQGFEDLNTLYAGARIKF
jgi:predicted porin